MSSMFLTTLPNALSAMAALILVVVTWRYTKHTQRMVDEMRAGRAAQLMPKLVPRTTWDDIGAKLQYIQIVNVGPGPAFDIDAMLSYEPGGLKWRWRGMVIASGATIPFVPSDAIRKLGGSGEMFADHVDLDDLAKRYGHIQLVGACRDAFGAVHTIDEQAPMNAGWTLVTPLGQDTSAGESRSGD